MEEKERIDLLNRQDFVERIITVTETLSKNKKNASYAIDGAWGVGKSFVMDMYEEQLSKIQNEKTNTNRYVIFHYNCWQYDYYEEPIISIIAAILDTIASEICVLNDEVKTKAKNALLQIGKYIFSRMFEKKTGISIDGISNEYKEIKEKSEKEIEAKHGFDTYFEFNKVLRNLRNTIEVLAEEQTVIFVVDELDRCLPEYTIKVLERLHHVFDEIPNMQLIISVDKNQLGHTIKQIYGEQTSVRNYLAKFIDFELKLDEGKINDKFKLRFAEYTGHFEIQYKDTKAEDIEAFQAFILDGIDTRNRIALIEKCQLIHNMIGSEEKLDSSYMCMEIMLAVLDFCEIDFKGPKQYFSISDIFGLEIVNGSSPNKRTTEGLKQFADTVQSKNGKLYYRSTEEINYVRTNNIFGVVLGGYRFLLGYDYDNWLHGEYPKVEFCEHTRKFWDIMQIIQ